MQGDAKVIESLNKVLANELIAINQYFLHAKMLKSWGFEKLSAVSFKESIDEMKHADLLIERILNLNGIPNLQDLGKLMIGQNTKEILECDLKLEHIALPALKDGIHYCKSVKDYVSADLLEKILSSEEEHIEWIETQLNLFNTLGERNYLQAMI